MRRPHAFLGAIAASLLVVIVLTSLRLLRGSESRNQDIRDRDNEGSPLDFAEGPAGVAPRPIAFSVPRITRKDAAAPKSRLFVYYVKDEETLSLESAMWTYIEKAESAPLCKFVRSATESPLTPAIIDMLSSNNGNRRDSAKELEWRTRENATLLAELEDLGSLNETERLDRCVKIANTVRNRLCRVSLTGIDDSECINGNAVFETIGVESENLPKYGNTLGMAMLQDGGEKCIFLRRASLPLVKTLIAAALSDVREDWTKESYRKILRICENADSHGLGIVYELE